MSPSKGRSLALVILAGALAGAGLVEDARAADLRVRKCAKRVASAVTGFSEEYVAKVGRCHIENLDDDPNVDCWNNADLREDVLDLAGKVQRQAKKCEPEALRALCPLGIRNPDEAVAAMTGNGASYDRGLGEILDRLFAEDNGPSCPRPAPRAQVPRAVEDCAKRLERVVREGVEELQKCFFGCMQSELQGPLSEPCVDESTGFPINRRVTSCVEKVFDDFGDDIASRCTADSHMVTLGCPMGASTVQGATVLAWSALYANVRAANLRIFDSPCRRALGGGGEPGQAVPATVTLFPSLTTKQVSCGEVLGAAFFGGNTELRFDSDLDCGPIAAPTDGIVIATSGVTVHGNSRNRSILGPAGGANRTGTGIRIAPGATGVRIKDFKSIDFFGVGIGDSGDNTGLEIDRVTVRRNTIAGIKTTSPGVDIEDAVADRNVLGFDLSGDDTQLRKSRARRSGTLPGYGIYLHGSDLNGNGRTVRVSECEIDDNVVGVWSDGQGHRIEENSFRGNSLEAAVLAGTQTRLDDNGIKLNGGDGVLVSGSSNLVTANRSDQNVGAGFVVTGSGNHLDGNGAGTLTDLGNGGPGYLLIGSGNTLTSNRAEANLEGGFVVQAANLLRSNRANGNQGIGFHITGTGSGLDTNVGEMNSGPEFVIEPNNSNLNGNRANGVTFSFGTNGGSFE